MITIVLSLIIGIFFTLVGFKVYKPKLDQKTDPKKWESNLFYFKVAGIIALGWAAMRATQYL